MSGPPTQIDRMIARSKRATSVVLVYKLKHLSRNMGKRSAPNNASHAAPHTGCIATNARRAALVSVEDGSSTVPAKTRPGNASLVCARWRQHPSRKTLRRPSRTHEDDARGPGASAHQHVPQRLMTSAHRRLVVIHASMQPLFCRGSSWHMSMG